MADEALAPGGAGPLGGLTNPRVLSLVRAPNRTRESLATFSAWRHTASADEGEGAITLVELSASVSLYRGEGLFLGWPAERLEAAYRARLPVSTEPGIEFNQLG